MKSLSASLDSSYGPNLHCTITANISSTIRTDTEQAERAIEGGTMVRRRFQRGSLFKRGKREKSGLPAGGRMSSTQTEQWGGCDGSS